MVRYFTVAFLYSALVWFSTQAIAAFPPSFSDELVIGNLAQPVAVTELQGQGFLVSQRNGTVLLVDTSTNPATSSIFLDIPNVDNAGEKGLLSLDLDPNFSLNGYVYAYYHNKLRDRARISRFTVSGSSADSSTEMLIWEDLLTTSLQIVSDHWGGGMDFRPDGYLYLAIGDKKDNPIESQDLSLVAGKIIRINTDGADLVGPWIPGAHNTHMIPPDNPFIDGPGGNLDEIWALGLRNPFRAQWDLTSGRFYIAEVGGKYPKWPKCIT